MTPGLCSSHHACFHLLKLKHDTLLSNVAFDLNLRPCTKLVAYTFLYWLPFYIERTQIGGRGRSRAAQTLWPPTPTLFSLTSAAVCP